MNENYTTALRMIDAGEKEKPKNRYAQVLKRPVARALASFSALKPSRKVSAQAFRT